MTVNKPKLFAASFFTVANNAGHVCLNIVLPCKHDKNTYLWNFCGQVTRLRTPYTTNTGNNRSCFLLPNAHANKETKQLVFFFHTNVILSQQAKSREKCIHLKQERAVRRYTNKGADLHLHTAVEAGIQLLPRNYKGQGRLQKDVVGLENFVVGGSEGNVC